jgi:hypothetical protein
LTRRTASGRDRFTIVSQSEMRRVKVKRGPGTPGRSLAVGLFGATGVTAKA